MTSLAGCVGGVTNALTVTREQLTGLSPALLGRTVTIDANAHTTTVTRAFEPGTDVIVETSRTGDAAPSVRRTLYGHELESAGPDTAALSTYDGFGRAVSQTVTNGAGTLSTSAVVYDNLGNAVTNTTTYGDLTAVTSTGYDSQGRAVSRTDALGNAVTNAYDSLGLTLSLSGATYPVQYAYDTVGRQTELDTTRDGLTWDKTRFLFDGATGLLTNKVYADGSRVVYVYTDVGRLASRTWARNIVTAYSYDTLGQPLTIDYPGTWYDVYYAYDVFGYASASSNSFAQYTFLNSLNGTATNETAVIGTNVFTLARSLDGHNRVVALTVDGTETAYGYDAESRVEGVTHPEATTVYAYTNGLSFGYTLTLTNGSTVTRALARDPYRRHLIVSVSNLFNGVFMRGVEYGHDLTDRRTGRVDSSPAVSATNAFLYNICSEVTNSVFDAYASAYSYDTIGNRVWSVENAVTNTYSANNLNQYIGLSYDADGNLLSDGSLSHTWDPENRLVRSEPAGIATNGAVRLVNRYDHRHRRIQKCVEVLTGRGAGYPMDPSQPGSWDAVETHTFFYDGWNLALETIAHTNGTVDRIEYVWGLDLSGTLQGAGGVGGLLFEKRNGQIFIPLYDVNGNVTDYVDSYGNVRGHFEYDAFGNTVAMWGDLANTFRFRFSTKYWDDETRSYYYGYRHYAPKLGCWLSKDPIGEEGGLKLYGFVGNDPINRWDYLGLKQTIIKSCNVIIYVGHNYAVPQKSIENEPCSAGKVISCGGYTSWDPATPDTEIPGLPPQNKGKSSILVNEAIDQTQKAFLAGVEYARETICKSDTCCCKKVTVKIICNFGTDIPLRLLFGKFGHGLCNKTETVKCGR